MSGLHQDPPSPANRDDGDAPAHSVSLDFEPGDCRTEATSNRPATPLIFDKGVIVPIG